MTPLLLSLVVSAARAECLTMWFDGETAALYDPGGDAAQEIAFLDLDGWGTSSTFELSAPDSAGSFVGLTCRQ